MQTTVVEATALSKVAYDDHLRALLIEFRNGTVYQYIDVPTSCIRLFSLPNPRVPSSIRASADATRTRVLLDSYLSSYGGPPRCLPARTEACPILL
jgi:hypothetical protein